MKTKIKRHSRSVLAVILTLCMLVSCMTVGLIATDAARVDSEEVGASTVIYFDGGKSMNWYFNVDCVIDLTDKTFDGSNLNLYIKNGSTQYGNNNSLTYGKSTVAPNDGASGNKKVIMVNAKNYSSATIKISQSGNNIKVDWTAGTETGGGGGETGDSGIYVMGPSFGGWSYTDVTTNNTQMFSSETSGLYYIAHTVSSTPNSDNFRFYKTSGVHYSPTVDKQVNLSTSGASDKSNVEAGSGYRNQVFAFKNFAADDKVILWLDTTNLKVWATYAKDDVVGSVTLGVKNDGSATLREVNETITLVASVDGTIKDYNLTYSLYRDGEATALETKTTTTGGAVEFSAITSNYQSKDYYVIVQKTGDSTTYNEKRSNTLTVYNTNEEYKPSYTVTVQVDNGDKTFGTVKVVSDTGTSAATTSETASANISVKEGHNVTITATPAAGCKFKVWTSGSTETTSTIRVEVNAAVTVKADFAQYRFEVYDGANYKKMRELPNGQWISVDSFNKVDDNSGLLTVHRLEDDKYIDPNVSSNTYWIENGNKIDVSGKWGSIKTGSTHYYTNHYLNGYLMYDPAKDKLWISDNDGGHENVGIMAKDGTYRQDVKEGSDPEVYNTHTCDFGDTTITIYDKNGNDITSSSHPSGDGQYDASAYGGNAVWINLKGSVINEGAKVKIKTVVNSAYKAKGYYVKGFVVKGHEETYAVLNQEFESNGTEVASYDDRAKIHGADGVEGGNPWNEFYLDVSDYPTEAIEITPVYFKKETKSGDNVRFYVDGFTGDVKEKWGDTLAVFAFKDGKETPFGEYPGQPMINYNGRYMVDIPRDLGDSITLNNYVWDRVHSNLYYGTSGKAAEGKNTGDDDNLFNVIKDINCQTYDFNDFTYIQKKLNAEGKDEDIIFSFRYKYNTSYNTRTNSNLGKDTYYVDSLTGSGAATNYDAAYDYITNHKTFTGDNSGQYQFEWLTDFYGNRVDVFGDLVDVPANSEKASQNPMRIVSNGYDRNKAGKYATAWALYDPASWSGDPGTYTLVDVIGGQGRAARDFQSESFLIDPDSTGRARLKYDGKAAPGGTMRDYWEGVFQEQNNSTSYPTPIADLAGRPVQITYEYAVKAAFSNLNLEGATGDGQPGLRNDGRWYYSSSDQLVKAHVIIEYAENASSEFKRDYFQPNSVDYNSGSYDPTKNHGVATGIEAFFTNDGEETVKGHTFSNTYGNTEAYGVTDGEYTFNLKTEGDEEGNYSFIGWYLYSEGGYTLITKDEELESEATNNDIYVARYIKTPSGDLQISHTVTDDSTGEAVCSAKAEILASDGTMVVDNTSYPYTTNAFKIGSKYIKSNSENKIRITLKTEPSAYSSFDSFMEKVSATLTALSAGTENQLGLNATVEFSTVGTTQYATITFPISKLFDNSGNQTTKATPFFSKLGVLDRQFKVKFSYSSRLWGDQAYTVTRAITPEEYRSGYFTVSGETVALTTDTSKRATFLASICPYEQNFKEDIVWDFNFATEGCTITGPTYTGTRPDYVVTSTTRPANKIKFKMELPFDLATTPVADNAIQPKTQQITVDGKKIDAVIYNDEALPFEPNLEGQEEGAAGKGVMNYQDWISLNEIHRSTDQTDANNHKEPAFVVVPKTIYQDNNDGTYTEMEFKYWDVKHYGVEGATAYKKCYNTKFNLSVYQSSDIEAVYGVVPETPSANPVDPVASEISTSLSWDQNSRNQWNNSDYGSAPYTNKEFADRVFVDFMVNYEYKGMQVNKLNETTDKVEFGVLLIKMDELDTSQPTLTPAEYKEANETGDNVLLHNAEVEGFLDKIKAGTALTPDEKAICKQSSFLCSDIDNKNMLDYAYTYANINQSGASAGQPTTHKDYLYRAYSYIIYVDNNNVKQYVYSSPEYFTFYDIASIESVAHATANE